MSSFPIEERVSRTIHATFATDGRAPARADVAQSLGLEAAEVDLAYQALAQSRDIVLGDAGQIVMAHPFASVNLAFSVMGSRVLWWGGCT